MRVAFSANSASRSAKASERREKKASWAARNRCQSDSSASFGARPAAFHSAISSLYRAAVGPQSVESDSDSASVISSSLRCFAATRCLSSSAKCAPRRRLNASRALENRFHSSSSVLRSTPLTVFHSSRMARSRSPAAFHWVDDAAISSASSASARFRAAASARARSRSARARSRACPAWSMTWSSRVRRASTSPTTAASASPSRRCVALVSACFGSPVPEFSRVSSSSASVRRSSNRRA